MNTKSPSTMLPLLMAAALTFPVVGLAQPGQGRGERPAPPERPAVRPQPPVAPASPSAVAGEERVTTEDFNDLQRAWEPFFENPGMIQRLGLTPDQVTALRQLHEERQPAAEANREAVQSSRKALHDAMSAETLPTTETINELIAAHTAALESQMKANFAHRVELREILTPEQFTQLLSTRRMGQGPRPGGPDLTGAQGIQARERQAAPGEGRGQWGEADREQMRQRFESMTDEERQEMRQRMQQGRQGGGPGAGRGPAGSTNDL